MYDKTSTIERFVEAAAARQPTPGGGSVAALAGALAASMGEMVVNYSIGKKGLESHAEQFATAGAKLHKLRDMLLSLMAEDQQAFESLSAAKKLADSDPNKAKVVQAAATICIRVPQSVAATAIAILDTIDSVVDFANKYLLSDLAVCADLAMATTRSAIYNVRVNLTEISDPTLRSKIESDIGQLLTRGLSLIQRIFPRIWARIGANE